MDAMSDTLKKSGCAHMGGPKKKKEGFRLWCSTEFKKKKNKRFLLGDESLPNPGE